MTPKVSICIPSYNQIVFLKKTLNSILEQDYQDYEVIITDDTPDDTVKDFVMSLNFNGKLKYYKNTVPLGTPENWNEAIRKSTGEYIKILHHDDWFLKSNSLRTFVNILDENQEVDFAFSCAYCINSYTGFTVLRKPSHRELTKVRRRPEALFPFNIISTPSTTIYRRSINIDFNKQFKWVVDVEYYFRVLLVNRRFAHISEPLVGITIESEHQVTNDCQGRKEVEVKEWVDFYQIVRENTVFRLFNARHLMVIFNNFNIRKAKDLKECGIKKINKEISFILILANLKSFFFLEIKVVKKIIKVFKSYIKKICRRVNYQITIVATGEKNERAKGSEVWVLSLINLNGEQIPLEDIKIEGDWEIRDGAPLSFKNQPSQLSWKGNEKNVNISFLSNSWAGIVKIKYGNKTDTKTVILDLYSEDSSSITKNIIINLEQTVQIDF